MTTDAHASLTGADLHEPKGVAAATSGQIYIANGAGSGVWTTPTVPTYPTLHIAGLLPTNASGDPTNDITVTTGTCRDITDTADMVLAAGLTKRLDAAWAVGDNQGGLDTGSIANTSYHVFLIKRTDTGVVDVLFSASATAPTMPASYTKKRRIGSFRRVAAAIQTISTLEMSGGALETLITPASDGTIVVTTGSATYTFSLIPAGVKLDSQTVCMTADDPAAASVANAVTVTSLDQSSLGSGLAVMVGANNGTHYASGSKLITRTNTSGQIRFTCTDGSITVTVHALGWVDQRRI